MAIFAVAFLQASNAQAPPFSWDRATIYAIGAGDTHPASEMESPSGAADFGAGLAGAGAGSVTLAAVKARVEDGFYGELGIDVLSLPVLFPTPGRPADLFPFDYGVVRGDLGSEGEFHALIQAAHRAGLRVLVSVQLPSDAFPIRIDSTGAIARADLEAMAADAWVAVEDARIRSLQSFFQRTGSPMNNMTAVVALLCDFVRATGLDGYRVAHADTLDPDTARLLKSECAAARRAWGASSGEPGAADFWLIGESRAQGLERTDPFDAGFDAMVATGYDAFPSADSAFSAFSRMIESDAELRVISSTASGPASLFDSEDASTVATNLMLMPGPVEIGAGTELAGASIPDHWSIPASFRGRHPAVAGGVHIKLDDDPYTFYRGLRLGARMDEVIVVMGASGKTRVNVTKVFPDDTVLRDANTGNIAIVSFGEVEFQAGENGVLLLEPLE
jgi:alpha-amylase